MINRMLVSKSSIYQNIESKGKKYDLSMLDKKNFIKLSDLNDVLGEIQMRNLPLTPFIISELENGRIILTSSDSQGSSIQIIPALNDNDDSKVSRVFVNCNIISKKEKKVNMNTGNLEDGVTIKNFEDLYNVLLGAYVALNTHKVVNNMSIMREIGEIYIDMIAQIISRGFGNPMDGEKLRFIIKMFFYNGIISGEELAGVEKYNVDSAKFLSSKYPEYFSVGDKTLEQLVEIINDEFPTIKDMSIDKFIGECVKAFGSNAVLAVDNYPYLMSVFVTRMRKDRSGVYGGYILKLIDPISRKMLSEILRAVN